MSLTVNNGSTITPLDGCFDNLSDWQKAEATDRAEEIKRLCYDAMMIYDQIEDSEVRLGVWELLKPVSCIRSMIKKLNEMERERWNENSK